MESSPGAGAAAGATAVLTSLVYVTILGHNLGQDGEGVVAVRQKTKDQSYHFSPNLSQLNPNLSQLNPEGAAGEVREPVGSVGKLACCQGDLHGHTQRHRQTALRGGRRLDQVTQLNPKLSQLNPSMSQLHPGVSQLNRNS